MSIRIRYSEEDGSLEREGIVTPKGSRVVAHHNEHIIVKLPGSSYHSGTGQPQGYAPAEFVLYEEVYTEDQRRFYLSTRDDEWPNGDVDGWINVREKMSWPVRS